LHEGALFLYFDAEGHATFSQEQYHRSNPAFEIIVKHNVLSIV
jgi:hypothetical protein